MRTGTGMLRIAVVLKPRLSSIGVARARSIEAAGWERTMVLASERVDCIVKIEAESGDVRGLV